MIFYLFQMLVQSAVGESKSTYFNENIERNRDQLHVSAILGALTTA